MLNTSVVGLCTPPSSFGDAVAVVYKETDGSNSPMGSESLCRDATRGSFSLVAPDAGVVCASFPLTDLAKDVFVPAETDLKATEYESDLRPLRPPESVAAPLSVHDQAFSDITKRAKKPAATDKSL